MRKINTKQVVIALVIGAVLMHLFHMKQGTGSSKRGGQS